MNHSGIIKSIFATLTILIFSSTAWAQQANQQPTGVGKSQQQDTQKGYSTKINFFVQGNAYLKDMDVKVTNMKDKVFYNGLSLGPWLVINLAPGKYQVTATRDSGQTESTSFHVASGQQTTVPLNFPAT